MRDNPVLCQMSNEFWFIERLDSEAQVIDVSCLCPGSRSTTGSESSVDRNQVNHRRACTKVHQAKVWPFADDFASKRRLVERDATFEAGDSEDDVVNALN